MRFHRRFRLVKEDFGILKFEGHLTTSRDIIPKTIGNRKRDCAWGGSGDKPYLRKSTDRKAQISPLN